MCVCVTQLSCIRDGLQEAESRASTSSVEVSRLKDELEDRAARLEDAREAVRLANER